MNNQSNNSKQIKILAKIRISLKLDFQIDQNPHFKETYPDNTFRMGNLVLIKSLEEVTQMQQ